MDLFFLSGITCIFKYPSSNKFLKKEFDDVEKHPLSIRFISMEGKGKRIPEMDSVKRTKSHTRHAVHTTTLVEELPLEIKFSNIMSYIRD